MSDEELKIQDAIVNGLIDHYKAVIEQYKAENSEDKIIRRTLENFMRGLWEEIQVGELEYTTSEVYEMLEREIFTDNHVAIPSAEPKKCKDCKWWRDSDGAYRRGVKAESRCPINTVTVANGWGYCYMFETQERSEE